jgi:hypothetical protein
VTGRPPEYVIVGALDSRGWLSGRDHLSLDGGETTLCGLRDSKVGGRSELYPKLFSDKAQRSANTWAGAFQCKRCARSAPPDMISHAQRLLDAERA